MSENKRITNENIQTILDEIYDKAIYGIPKFSKSIEDLAIDYLDKYKSVEIAIKEMQKNQIRKCATSGFITGFGGIITLPVSIPANISSVLYVQMRMVACTAYMSRFDITEDEVKTFIYACLAGVSVNHLVKKFGIDFGKKATVKGIKKIPRTILTKINQKIGFRFVTKFGEKGLINLGKMVPVVGAGINGSFDYVETRAIAYRAYKMFAEKDFSVGNNIDLDLSQDDFETQND